MNERLVVIAGPDAGTHHDVGDGGAIGRGRECAFQLHDAAVSREHARIERRDGDVVVVDLGSTNQTHVNGEPVETWVLAPGDRIALGETVLQFVPAEGGISEVERAPAAVTVELDARGGQGTARTWIDALTAIGDSVLASGSADGAVAIVREALGARRVTVMLPDASGWTRPIAEAVTDEREAAHVVVARELLARTANGRAFASRDGSLAFAVAPLGAGLVYVARDTDFTADEVATIAAAARMILIGLQASGARGKLARSVRALEDRQPRELLGTSAAIAAVREFVAGAGPSDATVLLLGETGAGKELVAWAIHQASSRGHGPFVAVNCAALGETLIDSELFGHEKGAFTGAIERRAGRFEQADGGTLFLDELGELPLAQQAKLLRVLELRRFERVGGTRPVAVDVRVVAATNRDLAAMVRARTFRADLFYRLGVLVGWVPALRDRADDVPLLAEAFLRHATRGRAKRQLSTDANRALTQHDWPGNVRELRNTIERLAILGEGRIDADEVRRAIAVSAGRAPSASPPRPTAGTLDEIEREAIVAALAACNGNKVHAARRLGIDRTTLYKKLHRYGMS